MRKIFYLEWLALTLSALVMGILWGTWFTLSRTITHITPEVFLGIGHESIANLAGPMRILMPATILSILLLLIFALRDHKKSAWLLGTSLLFVLGVLVITLAIEVPIDNQIKVWTVQTLPVDWTVLRERWEFYHTIRTFLSIGSFCALAWYVVIKDSLRYGSDRQRMHRET